MSSLPFWPIAVVDLLVIAMLIVSLPVIFLCTHVQCFVIGVLLRRASLDFDGFDGAVLFLFFLRSGFSSAGICLVCLASPSILYAPSVMANGNWKLETCLQVPMPD